jgi:hypothetical protein
MDLQSQEILPSIPCSRNLRRRTGVWLGVEAWEFFIIGVLSLMPDILYRVGLLAKPQLLAGVLISGLALGFVILFKRNRPPNYFSLWLHHHFFHPSGWRAPKTNEGWPILNERNPNE